MKKILLAVSIQLSAISLFAQTLNVQVGHVLYQFPAAQTAQMPYENGSTLSIMGKVFNLSEIDSMYVDETAVTDNTVKVAYSDTSADITVAGNIARLLSIAQTGAHVSIIQSADVANRLTVQRTRLWMPPTASRKDVCISRVMRSLRRKVR